MLVGRTSSGNWGAKYVPSTKAGGLLIVLYGARGTDGWEMKEALEACPQSPALTPHRSL